MSSVQGRILVIRGGAIGDFVLTLPALAALRAHFPNAHLEVLGYPHITQLALAGGVVDAVRAIEARGLAGFFARHGALDEDIANYFSQFNLILTYLFDPDGIFRTNVAACGSAQIIQCPHRPDESQSVHATEVYLKPLEQLAIFDADPVPRLELGPTAGNDGLLAVHPGSGSDRKNWPESRWAMLLQRLIQETDFQLLIVGGEAEGERLDRLIAPLPKARLCVARSLPLVALAKQLRPCCAFAGHDSGITHIAAALGLPCVVLWPDTNEAIWRPQGTRIALLKEKRGLRALDIDWVFSEVVAQATRC
jgi:ADP-heptose:LPS heptosyltransferase